MKKRNALFIFFFAIYIIEYPKRILSTEVLWDFSKDIIYYEGKLYYPSDNNEDKSQYSQIHPNKSNETEINEKENNSSSKDEEELVSGGKFWFFVFMISSKININFSFGCWIWIIFWLDSGILIN